jgi:hypothetical protein
VCAVNEINDDIASVSTKLEVHEELDRQWSFCDAWRGCMKKEHSGICIAACAVAKSLSSRSPESQKVSSDHSSCEIMGAKDS